MAILVQDSFNRIDNLVSLGVADTGQTWVPFGSNKFGIESNKARATEGAGYLYALIDASVSDYSLSCTIAGTADNTSLVFRYVDISNTFILRRTNSTTLSLIKVVAGASTTIATTTHSHINGDVWKVLVDGSNIKAFINSVEIISITETFNQTATKVGLNLHSGTMGTTRWDDFLVESLATGGTAYTASLSDSITLSETISKAFTAVIVDTVTAGDSDAYNASVKNVADSVTTTDSLTSMQGKAVNLADTVTIMDAISKALAQVITDSVTLADADTNAITRTLLDAVTATDTITVSGGTAIALTDTITVSDATIAKAISAIKTESIGLTDSDITRVVSVSVRLYDVVVTAETFTKTLPGATVYVNGIAFNVHIKRNLAFDTDIKRNLALNTDIVRSKRFDTRI